MVKVEDLKTELIGKIQSNFDILVEIAQFLSSGPKPVSTEFANKISMAEINMVQLGGLIKLLGCID